MRARVRTRVCARVCARMRVCVCARVGGEREQTVIELSHASSGWIRFKNLALDEVGREASPVFYAHSSSVFEVFFPAPLPCPRPPPPPTLLSSGHGQSKRQATIGVCGVG